MYIKTREAILREIASTDFADTSRLRRLTQELDAVEQECLVLHESLAYVAWTDALCRGQVN